MLIVEGQHATGQEWLCTEGLWGHPESDGHTPVYDSSRVMNCTTPTSSSSSSSHAFSLYYILSDFLNVAGDGPNEVFFRYNCKIYI